MFSVLALCSAKCSSEQFRADTSSCTAAPGRSVTHALAKHFLLEEEASGFESSQCDGKHTSTDGVYHVKVMQTVKTNLPSVEAESLYTSYKGKIAYRHCTNNVEWFCIHHSTALPCHKIQKSPFEG